MAPTRVTLAEAASIAASGDVWLFTGRKLADRAIRAATNSPVNHVAMVLAIDDLPPLLWHAELGSSLPDVWTAMNRRGAQLHRLVDAAETWVNRYGQSAYFRQLTPTVSKEAENAALAWSQRTRAPLPVDGLTRPTLAPRAARARRVARGHNARSSCHHLPADGPARRRAPAELVRLSRFGVVTVWSSGDAPAPRSPSTCDRRRGALGNNVRNTEAVSASSSLPPPGETPPSVR
jgi:hypothetical protein